MFKKRETTTSKEQLKWINKTAFGYTFKSYTPGTRIGDLTLTSERSFSVELIKSIVSQLQSHHFFKAFLHRSRSSGVSWPWKLAHHPLWATLSETLCHCHTFSLSDFVRLTVLLFDILTVLVHITEKSSFSFHFRFSSSSPHLECVLGSHLVLSTIPIGEGPSLF